MKVLVTGGAGFIGSQVADGYLKAGHEVVVVDNLYTGKRENLPPEAKFYLMDIRTKEIQKVLEYEKPEIINHHAAQISVPASVNDPAFDASVNIQGLINLLEAARRQKIHKIIFISSGGAIYGEAKEYPTSENCTPQPLSPYAIAKAVAENYLRFYEHQYGLNYTVLRYSNIYGPRQVPHGEAGVVAIFMDRLLGNKPGTIYHFPFEPEGMIRDYCFVEDVVEANILALATGNKKSINIGTGKETRTQTLFETIFDVISERYDLDDRLRVPNRTSARPGDLKKSCLKIELAKEILWWKPKTNLFEGIKKTLDWRIGLGNA
jgi:UDP-glucose 4-epimerase